MAHENFRYLFHDVDPGFFQKEQTEQVGYCQKFENLRVKSSLKFLSRRHLEARNDFCLFHDVETVGLINKGVAN
jgi:hypothetical protein